MSNNSSIISLFSNLWEHYVDVTPSALNVHELLGDAQVSDIKNDHVAFRTFDDKRINLEKLAKHFVVLGYVEAGHYTFDKKFLRAKHFEHPSGQFPRVFISELQTSNLSQQAQDIIANALSDVSGDVAAEPSFLFSGTHWAPKYSEYQTLLAESEYAAWLYVWGIRVNHFTVYVNDLERFSSIEEVNSTLKQSGFELNAVGGEVKGSSEQLLKQSSTLADLIELDFVDGKKQIPSCFYEFAERYKKHDGNLFSGFIASSADKIFESTNSR